MMHVLVSDGSQDGGSESAQDAQKSLRCKITALLLLYTVTVLNEICDGHDTPAVFEGATVNHATMSDERLAPSESG